MPPRVSSIIFQAGSANRSSPERRLKSNGSFKHEEIEDHQEKAPWSVDLNRPQPTGVGRQSLSLARNILSAEQLISVEDKISKKAAVIKQSNLSNEGRIISGGTVAERKDISLEAQHVSSL